MVKKYVIRFTQLIGLIIHDIFNLKNDEFKIFIPYNKHPFWRTYFSHPPIKYLKTKYFSKIYHSHNLIPTGYKGYYITDIEHILHLSGYSRNYKKMIESAGWIEEQLNDSRCKAIILPTDGAKREVLKYLKHPESIEKKIVKIFPSFETKPAKKKEFFQERVLNILFIGNKFWGKGTPIAIRVFENLRKKFKDTITFSLVCNDIPPEFKMPREINVISNQKLTESLRDELYGNAHLFLFPCLHDSFGVYLEALAYGVPVLTTKIYDKDEIVLHNKTGFLFDTPISLYDGNFGNDYRSWSEFIDLIKESLNNGLFDILIEQLTSQIETLIKDRNALEQLSINSQNFCANQLSFSRKNQEILEVYSKVIQEINKKEV